MKGDRENGKCEKNTKGNLYFQLKVNPHLFHPRKCRPFSLRPKSPRDATHVFLPRRLGRGPQLLRKGGVPCHFVGTSWVGRLTRSFLPKMVTLPLICSFLRRHSMELRPFSMGREILQRPMVGVMVPASTWGSLWKLTPIPLAYITRRVPLLQSW